jgi:hypothetical protein
MTVSRIQDNLRATKSRQESYTNKMPLTSGVCSWRSCVFEGFAYEGHEKVWNERKTSTSLHWPISHH